MYYDDEGNVYDEDVFGDDDYDNYEHWDEDEYGLLMVSYPKNLNTIG